MLSALWTTIVTALLTFFSLFFVALFSYSVRRLRAQASKELIQPEKLSLYYRLHRFFLKDLSLESLLFCAACIQNILRIILLFSLFSIYYHTSSQSELSAITFISLLSIVFILCLDLLPRLLAHTGSQTSFRLATAITKPLLLLFSPICFALYRLIRLVLPNGFLSPFSETAVSSRENLLEFIRNVDDSNPMNEHDKKLLRSLFSFRDRIAREVMVPRVNLFSLPHETSIRDAAKLLQKEGYSRVPVYKGTPDHILGVLMYKDILTKYMEFETNSTNNAILDDTVESLVKGVLYTPETKKISLLLQDFRKKQTHLAVVVDEYGGTAGVVTIEDILEEIVGEIADEYDEEEKLYWPLQRGGWIVDGRMNLLDLEEEIGLKIPQDGEYDTVTGYVYFRLGTIPKKGVILHHDEFEIEILHSDDRFVQKVKITPLIKAK